MDSSADSAIAMLRHTLATVAYRAAKTLRGAPGGFQHVRATPTTRSAGQILAHIGDLVEWAMRAADGKMDWHESRPDSWEREVARFFAALKALDDRLATQVPLACPPQKLFQGPIADVLTHVGQLATLRRLAGSPVRGENYFQADIRAGRVGLEQSPPVQEFD